MDAIGSAGAAVPFLDGSVAVASLLQLQRSPLGDAVLADVASGIVVALAGLDPRMRPSVSATPLGERWRLDGDALLVLDGGSAERLIVAARTEGYSSALLLVSPHAEGLSRRTYPTIDGRTAADLRFIGVEAELLATDVDEPLTEAGDLVLACLAVEAAAVMRRLVEDTVAYTRQREQFGQAIAGFQVIQHRLVDMHIQAQRATAIATRALDAADAHWAERGRLASAAKATVIEAGRFVGQNAVQLHGGMGMTQELAIGRLFKRLTAIEQELGGLDQHRQRFARLAAHQTA
jgi:alkylation response protein AidB-like acyl-CoA dehydrogenase